MSNLWFDCLHICRRLKRDPRFAAAVLFSLGLGNGLSTATFSVINAVLLRPFPYHEPDRLGIVWGSTSWEVRSQVDRAEIRDWMSTSRVVESGAFFLMDPIPFTLDGGAAVKGGFVGPRTFSLLGMSPVLGRSFLEGDDQTDDADSVVVSHSFWTSHFEADRAALGKTLRLNGRLHKVIGVMPPGFFFPDQYFQLWLPLLDPGMPAHALVRLRPGAAIAQAQAELSRSHDSRSSSGGAVLRSGPGVHPLVSVAVSKYRLALGTLLGAVVLLLLIASANAANLLLERGVAKAPELAVCAALGATPSRVFRLLLLESLVLGLSGGAIGIVCGFAALRVLRSLQLTDVLRFEASEIDGRVLLFALGVSIVTGVIAGVWPAWKAARLDLVIPLQMGSGGTPSLVHAQVRDLLVASGTALALVLLITAGLFTSSFVRLVQSDWGFDPDGLIVVEVFPSKGARQSSAYWTNLVEGVSERLRKIPGVNAVALSFGIPIKYGYSNVRIALDGRRLGAESWTVGDGYFRAMGIPILRGVEFGGQGGARGERVTIVNRGLANRLWPGQDPIGKDVQLLQLRRDIEERLRASRSPFMDPAIARSPDSWEPGGAPWRVIGEVGEVPAFGLDLAPDPAMYLDYRQDNARLPGRGILVARTTIDPQRAVAVIRKEIAAVVGSDSVRSVTSMSSLVETSIGGRGSNKLLLVVSTLLGGVGLLLATVGVYSVVSLGVRQRGREIAVRRVLGARPRNIVLKVLKEGMRPVLFGVTLGLSGALYLTRGIQGLLFGVTPMDPLTLAGASIALLLPACVGCVLPAIRALAQSPAETLRQQ